ncbi:MAG: HYR domain-containing protein, partial [Actinomycetota bacterium]|nr:HYR domain-containing protein [Actinomycetota bacterium]
TALSDLCGATGSATVTFTLTDECGNFITKDATFTIGDTQPPAITCPGPILRIVPAGTVTITITEAELGTATATDNCGTPSVTNNFSSQFPGDVVPVGVHSITWTATDACGNTATCTQTITVLPAHLLQLTVFLQGPYNTGTGLMNTDLNPAQLPAGQPYNTAPWYYTGAEILPTPLPSTVVDWVLVEIRSDIATGVARRAGLLHRDGSVAVSFDGSAVSGQAYFIVVFHRNHLPVMSATAIEIPVSGATYNFTLLSNVYGGGAILLGIPGKGALYGMIAGDVSRNGILKYSGPRNDRSILLGQIIVEGGGLFINPTPGYWFADVNMNNILSYQGAGNDRGIIIANIGIMQGTPLLTAVYESVVPGTVSATMKYQSANNGPVNIHLMGSAQGIGLKLTTTEFIRDGLVDNIQFALAWNANDIGIEQMLANYVSAYMLEAQGKPVVIDGIKYQVFATANPTYLPALWNEEEVTALWFETSLGLQIGKRLWIADNDFTSQHNAMYYVSVWGKDFTGVIKAMTVRVDDPAAGHAIRLYPNPVSNGKLMVEITGIKDQSLRMGIYDIHGKLLLNIASYINDNENKTLDVSALQPGVYVLKLTGNRLMYQKKFIVMSN